VGPSVNGSEEGNELAWRRIADLFGFKTGNNTHRPSTLLHSDASLDLESILDCVSVSLKTGPLVSDKIDLMEFGFNEYSIAKPL